ncbi:MAG TPA: YtxH domain-containing protein [Massilibacterium sp.]|nr:YtxH domain-containing protein [Massilibacterium sp.]
MANDSKNFVLGALIGSVVGAAVALLFAPKSGKDLREDVSTQVDNIKEKSIEIANTAKEKTTNIAQTAKEKSSDLKEYVSSQSEEIKNKVKNIKKDDEEAIHDSWQEDLDEEELLTEERKTIPIE